MKRRHVTIVPRVHRTYHFHHPCHAHRDDYTMTSPCSPCQPDGFATMAWVNPAEKPGGVSLAAEGIDADWMHGCFAYQMQVTAECVMRAVSCG